MLALRRFNVLIILGVVLLCKTNVHGDEFGINILSVDRTRQGGYLNIIVTIRAPPNSQYYWAFGYGYLPVLDSDPFSSVENEQKNGVIVSRLRTSVVNEEYVTFKIFTYDPAYRGMDIDIKTKEEDSRRFYNNTCQYMPPSHYKEGNRIVATATFTCDMLPEQDLSDSGTGIEYRAETISKIRGKAESFVSITSKNNRKTTLNGKLTVTKVVKKDKAWVESRAGVLGVFQMNMKMADNDTGPIYGFRYFVEDGKSFDGESNSPIDQGVFEPYSLVRSVVVSMTEIKRQAFLSCHAIGFEVPEVEIVMQTESDGEISLQSAKMVHKTKFASTVYYVINDPSTLEDAIDDDGILICRTRLGGMEKQLTTDDAFYSRYRSVIVGNQSGMVHKFYKEKIQLRVEGHEDMTIACSSNTKDEPNLTKEEWSLFRVQKGQPGITEYFVNWPNGKIGFVNWENERYGYTSTKAYCTVTNVYGGDSIEIDGSKANETIVMNY